MMIAAVKKLKNNFRHSTVKCLTLCFVTVVVPFHIYAQTPAQCFDNPSLCQKPNPAKKNIEVTNNGSPAAVDSIESAFNKLNSAGRIQVQTSLANLGLYKSSLDGLYGKGTRRAILQYLTEKGIDKKSSTDLSNAISELAKIQSDFDMASPENFSEKEGDEKQKAIDFISDVEEYVRSGQSSFDLNFAVEYGKIRGIKQGEWSAQLQRTFGSFRFYVLSETGFSDFHKKRSEDRRAASAAKLSATKKELFDRLALMRSWAQANLLDQRTEAVIEAISSAEEVLLADEIKSIQDTLAQVKQLSSEIGIAELTTIDPGTSSSVIPDSIYLFGNFTGNAPHLFKGISGEPELTGTTAEVCLVGALDKWQRYSVVDFLVGSMGAENITLSEAGCFGSEDVSAVLGSRLIEGDLPSSFSAGYEELLRLDRKVTVAIKEKFELVGEVYEDDLLKAQKIGFGLLSFDPENGRICTIVGQNFPDHSSALKSNIEVMSLYGAVLEEFSLSDDVLDAFRRLQRNECGFVYGSAEDLSTLIEAARNNKMNYDVLPIWISPETIERIVVMRTEYEKQQLSDQASRDNQKVLNEKALEAAMQKAIVAQGILRSENEVRFSAVIEKLSSGILTAVDFGFKHSPLDSNYQELYQDLEIIDITTGNSSAFDPIINDIQSLSLEKWEKTGFILNKTDYGTVEYNGRTLEGVISELQVSLKNRVVGDFMTYCRIIRAVNDTDFDMWRQIEISECGLDDGQWRLANSFDSKWIVSTEQ